MTEQQAAQLPASDIGDVLSSIRRLIAEEGAGVPIGVAKRRIGEPLRDAAMPASSSRGKVARAATSRRGFAVRDSQGERLVLGEVTADEATPDTATLSTTAGAQPVGMAIKTAPAFATSDSMQQQITTIPRHTVDEDQAENIQKDTDMTLNE